MRTILALLLCWPALTAVAAARTAEDDARAIDDPRVQHLTYPFPETGETLPYALFVPQGYDPASPAPTASIPIASTCGVTAWVAPAPIIWRRRIPSCGPASASSPRHHRKG